MQFYFDKKWKKSNNYLLGKKRNESTTYKSPNINQENEEIWTKNFSTFLYFPEIYLIKKVEK